MPPRPCAPRPCARTPTGTAASDDSRKQSKPILNAFISSSERQKPLPANVYSREERLFSSLFRLRQRKLSRSATLVKYERLTSRRDNILTTFRSEEHTSE